MSRSQAPPLLPIFRSRLQGELLTRVLLTDTKPSISDLARELDVPFATVHREAERLLTAGLLAEERVGRSRILTANTANLAYKPLRDLVLIAFGPKQVVTDEFTDVDGVEKLFIYGSWAARYLGEPGPEPGDIDVLVVGHANRDDLYDAAERAESRLRRDVNPTVVSSQRWDATEEPFLQELRRRPLVDLTPADRAERLTQGTEQTV